jgi:hypothetical protein
MAVFAQNCISYLGSVFLAKIFFMGKKFHVYSPSSLCSNLGNGVEHLSKTFHCILC